MACKSALPLWSTALQFLAFCRLSPAHTSLSQLFLHSTHLSPAAGSQSRAVPFAGLHLPSSHLRAPQLLLFLVPTQLLTGVSRKMLKSYQEANLFQTRGTITTNAAWFWPSYLKEQQRGEWLLLITWIGVKQSLKWRGMPLKCIIKCFMQ